MKWQSGILSTLLISFFAVFAARSQALPAPSISPDAAAELRGAIDILKAHHINRDKVDWKRIEQEAFEQAKDAKYPIQTYPAIRWIINQLGEKHSQLLHPDYVKALRSGKKEGNANPPHPTPPEGVLLADRIGMLRVLGFQGPEGLDRAYVGVLRKKINQLRAQGICRYIVDLRENEGGNMFPMLNGLKSLLGAPPYGYYWSSPAVESVPWVVRDLPTGYEVSYPTAGYADPSFPILKPAVAVLVDVHTASAGEFTAIAFESRPATRIFGQPSAGYVTANEGFVLPDGARLAVATSWATDRAGRLYQDAITPDEQTAPGQETLDTAISWLKAQECSVR